jgi:hypothetical protein
VQPGRIDRVTSSDPALIELLRGHPGIEAVEPGPSLLGFWQGDWSRAVGIGDSNCPLRGLVEMIDNNPMVCADAFSLADPLSLLALAALGPLADAGLILEVPTLITNVEGSADEVGRYLTDVGWTLGLVLEVQTEATTGRAGAATAMVEIPTLDDPDEIDALYEERFGRSFYVRRAEDGEWDVSRVLGTASLLYRLRLTEDSPRSLLTIQVMADLDGKLGRLGLLHAMNVMAGFEESLGIP